MAEIHEIISCWNIIPIIAKLLTIIFKFPSKTRNLFHYILNVVEFYGIIIDCALPTEFNELLLNILDIFNFSTKSVLSLILFHRKVFQIWSPFLLCQVIFVHSLCQLKYCFSI